MIWHNLCITVLFALMGVAVVAAAAQSGHAGCNSNLKQLALGLEMYSLDYDGKLPRMKSQKSFEVGLRPYVRATEIFKCPETGQAYLPTAALAGNLFKKVPSASSTILLRDSKPHSDGTYNVVYADRHLATVKKVPNAGKAAPGKARH